LLPSSGTLNLGYTQDLGPHSTSSTVIPGISATWQLRSRFAIRSSAAYIQERNLDTSAHIAQSTSGDPRSLFGSQPPERVIRSEYLPLATGLRFYAGKKGERTRGLFLDAAPAVYLVRLPRDSGGTYMKAPLGLQLGGGIRVPAIDGSRMEIGMRYDYVAAKAYPLNSPNSRQTVSGSGSGLDLFSLYFAIGFGD